MKVQIEDKLYLESDGMQFILKEYTGRTAIKDGKTSEVTNTKGYFQTVEGALTFLVKMKLMESTATDLQTLISSVKEVRDYLKERVTV